MNEQNADFSARALSFGQAAQEYDSGRPSYPADLYEKLIPNSPCRVLDLGAGTGKFTAGLIRPGVSVVAVEPIPEMREIFKGKFPGIEILSGSAEQIPLPERAIDATFVAQAWHWVDASRAIPELTRVLKPGGWLHLIWNRRVHDEGWLKDLEDLMSSKRAMHSRLGQLELGEKFSEKKLQYFHWQETTNSDLLLKYMMSQSFVIKMESADRQKLVLDIEKILNSYEETRHGTFTIPFRTEVYSAHLLV